MEINVPLKWVEYHVEDIYLFIYRLFFTVYCLFHCIFMSIVSEVKGYLNWPPSLLTILVLFCIAEMLSL